MYAKVVSTSLYTVELNTEGTTMKRQWQGNEVNKQTNDRTMKQQWCISDEMIGNSRAMRRQRQSNEKTIAEQLRGKRRAMTGQNGTSMKRQWHINEEAMAHQ